MQRMVRSYVRIYGPPISKALEKLEKVAKEIPEIIYQSKSFGISIEREIDPISKAGPILGEYDFFFEWKIKLEEDMVDKLICRIDKALQPLGCRYTITIK
jgi:hypothetical protein